MRKSLLPVSPVLCSVVALSALGLVPAGCSDDAASPHDAGVDSAVPEVDAATPALDAASTQADSAAADAGVATCELHLDAGFTNVVTSTSDGDFGRHAAMVLDENDDPMFAYVAADAAGDATVYFVRWDPCVGAFTKPLAVDTVVGISNGHGERQVAIAYDATAQKLGVVYQKIVADPGANDAKTIWLATRTGDATSFSKQQVSEGVQGDSYGASTPSIAMSAQKLYLAYVQDNYDCGGSGGGCTGLWFLESATDGAAASFSRATIPYDGDVAQALHASVSVAVNSAGTPAVAFYVAGTDYNTALVFWQKGTVEAALVTDSNGIQNDSVDVSLRFDGLKPRVAGHLVASSSADYDLTYVESDDGSTWYSAIHLPEDGNSGTAFTSALALDGKGNVAVAADTNSGSGDNVCGNPYLARSKDGVAFAACGADTAKAHQYSVDALNAAYGASRLKGKLTLGFQNSNTEKEPAGVVYWQDK